MKLHQNKKKYDDNIYIHTWQGHTTDKPITLGPKIDKISQIKTTLGLEKERLVRKAKSSRRRG